MYRLCCFGGTQHVEQIHFTLQMLQFIQFTWTNSHSVSKIDWDRFRAKCVHMQLPMSKYKTTKQNNQLAH